MPCSSRGGGSTPKVVSSKELGGQLELRLPGQPTDGNLKLVEHSHILIFKCESLPVCLGFYIGYAQRLPIEAFCCIYQEKGSSVSSS